MTKKSLLLLLFFMNIASQSFEKNWSIVLYNPELEVSEQVRIAKKKVRVPVGTLGVFTIIYMVTLPMHIRRGVVSGCLLWLCLWDLSAFKVGFAVFLLSSLVTWAQMAATKVKSVRGQKMLRLCVRGFEIVYRFWALGLLVAAIYFCICEIKIAEWEITNPLGLSPIFFCVGALQIRANDKFRVNFYSTDALLKIEENSGFYRVTIGVMSWQFAKNNVFMRIVFAILIYSALRRRGARQVINADTLGQALGWKNRLLFYKLFVEYQRAGNDLSVIVRDAIKAHVRNVRNKALEIWLEDLNQDIKQVRAKLRTLGLSVSTDKIRESLRLVDFNDLVKKLRVHYCKKCDRDLDRARTLEVTEQEDSYLLRVGPFIWTIGKKDRFLLIALLHVLHRVRDPEGRKIFTLEQLSAGLFNSMQRLDQLFEQYRMIAKHYRDLRWVGLQRLENNKLAVMIQEIWLKDFTLSVKDVADRLVERGVVESITTAKVRKLAGSVDFLKIRSRLMQDYKQGRYRKSTQWIMAKYQHIIEELLERLARGETWQKAEIDKYVADIPTLLPTRHMRPTGERSGPNIAWLRCFLFNLAKSMNNKIMCPNCGKFETSRKSTVPEPHIIKDPKTGQGTTVHTFRFYCNNHECSTGSFTATPDGSHILDEDRFAKACVMLRLAMGLKGSYRAVGQLLGVSRSTVFQELTYISQCAGDWEKILGITRFSGTLCIDEKFVKIAELKGTSKRPFAYLFFAVDPRSGDLLHIEIFASRDQESVEAFLSALKARGIIPEAIMTDLMSAYDKAIRNVFGRSVVIQKCHFHFKMNIFEHMRKQFGKKHIPDLATQLKSDIFFIVDHKSKKSIHNWYAELMKQKPRYLEREPRLAPMFDCLDNYLPHLLRAVENPKVIVNTNNAAELVIRHFNQRYKLTAGFKSLETAQRHARLFQLVYRFTPFSQDAQHDKRSKTPLELAGYDVRHMPIYHYLTEPLLFNLQPAQNLALCRNQSA